MPNYITRIFVLEDDPVYGKVLKNTLEKDHSLDVSVFTTGQDFLDNLHQRPGIVTIDQYLPDMEGLDILKRVIEYDKNIIPIMLSGQQEVETVVKAYKLGARDYIMKEDNAPVMLMQSIKNFSANLNLRREVEALRDQIIDRSKYNTLVGESKPILEILRLIQKVEKTSMQVMITGASGTGKEIVAQTIHFNSDRRRRNFVPVNMGAIPEDLIESELFGHEKGAFTGANSKRIGRFEEADGGTIFLDEIGEMDMNLQTKLLRVLQDNTITRVGGNRPIKLDLRVVAATNKNLAEMVKQGKFREDLYYRLQGFLINMPLLKDRGNDIILLAKYFSAEYAKANRLPDKHITKPACAALLEHPWPGNVRELKSVIERGFLISDTAEITPEDLIFSQMAF